MFKQNEKAIAQIADYIPRACRGMQLQEAKARLEKKLRSILMTAVMPPFLTRRSHQLLTVTLGSLFFMHRSATPQRRQPVSQIDYQKLREIAEKTKIAGEAPVMPFYQRINALNDFMKHFSPDIALALLDERERNQQYIKRRDQENEDIALTVGRLRVELEGKDSKIANLTAERDALREGEIGDARHSNTRAAADIYFQLVEECEIPAGGSLVEYVDDMREKLEAAEKRIAELEAREIKPAKGEVLVVVSGFTGCGKSAIAGEIEIAMKAIGVPVQWTNGDAEKHMTGADWLTAIEMYKPTVRIVEVNVPRAAGIRIKGE